MDHQRRQRPARHDPRPGQPRAIDADERAGAGGAVPAPVAGTGGPSASELELRARELERRAVDADAAVADAMDGRSRPGGSEATGSISASQLRRLRLEADQLMDRAIMARLEADRAADGATTDGGAPRVQNWNHPEWGWERLLSAALEEAPSPAPRAPTASPNGAAGGHGDPRANGAHDPTRSSSDANRPGIPPDAGTPGSDAREG